MNLSEFFTVKQIENDESDTINTFVKKTMDLLKHLQNIITPLSDSWKCRAPTKTLQHMIDLQVELISMVNLCVRIHESKDMSTRYGIITFLFKRLQHMMTFPQKNFFHYPKNTIMSSETPQAHIIYDSFIETLKEMNNNVKSFSAKFTSDNVNKET